MPTRYFIRIMLGIAIVGSCLSGGSASAMSEKLNCGKIGILSIIDNESRGRIGKYKGVISAPALGLKNIQ